MLCICRYIGGCIQLWLVLVVRAILGTYVMAVNPARPVQLHDTHNELQQEGQQCKQGASNKLLR